MSLININTSDYGFKPDVEHNRILYGLKALSNINSETIDKIKAGRPYIGIKDFMTRCPLNKTAMINLIKAGAFDEVETNFKSRKEIMVYYISQIYEGKKKLNLQNFNGLIQHNLVPKEYELQVRIFNFNKYIKTKKVGKYYTFDDMCTNFFEKFLCDYIDELEIINGIVCILQTTWDKLYSKLMDPARDWLKDNQEKVLEEYNKILFMEVWNKYCKGTISKWEMDSLCFYYNKHELAGVDFAKYGIDNYNNIPDQEIDYYFKRGKTEIPIYKIRRIAGTVIAKDDGRHSIFLLTTDGVVNVKFSSDQYAKYKRQISQINPDGSKTIIEKSWFGRGNMLIISGFRRDDTFVCKTYKSTQSHHLYHIDKIEGDSVLIRHTREIGIEEEEYDEYNNR